MDKRIAVIFLFLWFLAPSFAQEQADPPKKETQEQTDPPNQNGGEGQEQDPDEESGPISGGVIYEPQADEDEKLRDPFKSPFELEAERKKKKQVNANIPFPDQRLPIPISDLELTGIYLQTKTGYLAIFRVGDDYKWFPAGTKFLDADLVNITDRSVVFKHYVSGEDLQVREVVKVLRSGEERL